MRKKLFDRYVELNCYRLAANQLCKSKQITKTDLRAVEAKVALAELALIIPKQSKTHSHTLTRVK